MKKKTIHRWTAWLLSLALLLGSAGPALAYEDEAQEKNSITVTFRDGEEILLELELNAGETPSQVPELDAEGEPILGWIREGKKVTDPSAIVLDDDTEYIVWSLPAFHIQEDIPYISGKGEGRFAPKQSLTRAEAASMIAALLEDSAPGPFPGTFPDVANTDWYCEPVTALAALGVVSGYETGEFLPGKAITRAEFLTILSSFYPLEQEGDITFSDVPTTHWAHRGILSAASKGWIKGYADGSFRPDQNITRAEAVAVLNASLGRSAAARETQAMLRENGVCIFTDVKPDDWFYADVMEASIPHTFSSEGSGEIWTGFTYRSCGYAPGFQKIGSAYYNVDENGQITFFTPGIQEINGKLYYAAEDGSIPAAAGPREIGDGLYYVQDDGSLLVNDTAGYLHFDENGRYTSGNPELDGYVNQLLNSCTNAGMTTAEKLRAVYLVIREYRYLSRPHQARGSTDWAESTALWTYQNERGNCYCYSAAFLYAARRLGYQAYVISGGYGPNNRDHAWVMIGDRVYDPCLENVYRYRSSVVHYYDLYHILPDDAPIQYHFPG